MRITKKQKIEIEETKKEVDKFYNEHESDIKKSYRFYLDYKTHGFRVDSYKKLDEKCLKEKLKNKEGKGQC